MNITRELPHAWIEGGVTYHEAYGKRTTVWVNCAECNKRQPAGTETLSAYGGAEVTKVERLSSLWAKPEIGRCSVCFTRGPLVEVKLITRKGQQADHCDKRCMEASGDECNCSACQGRDHGTGTCSCGKETA